MPKGVYQRVPGKKNKSPNDGGLPQKKYDRSSFNKRPNFGGSASSMQKRGTANQVTTTLSLVLFSVKDHCCHLAVKKEKTAEAYYN